MRTHIVHIRNPALDPDLRSPIPCPASVSFIASPGRGFPWSVPHFGSGRGVAKGKRSRPTNCGRPTNYGRPTNVGGSKSRLTKPHFIEIGDIPGLLIPHHTSAVAGWVLCTQEIHDLLESRTARQHPLQQALRAHASTLPPARSPARPPALSPAPPSANHQLGTFLIQ